MFGILKFNWCRFSPLWMVLSVEIWSVGDCGVLGKPTRLLAHNMPFLSWSWQNKILIARRISNGREWVSKAGVGKHWGGATVCRSVARNHWACLHESLRVFLMTLRDFKTVNFLPNLAKEKHHMTCILLPPNGSQIASSICNSPFCIEVVTHARYQRHARKRTIVAFRLPS